jgi:hypothetical protein
MGAEIVAATTRVPVSLSGANDGTTNGDGQMTMQTAYALLIEYDGSEMDLSLYSSHANALRSLRDLAASLLADKPPENLEDVVQRLIELESDEVPAIVDVRLWQCQPDGESGKPIDLQPRLSPKSWEATTARG